MTLNTQICRTHFKRIALRHYPFVFKLRNGRGVYSIGFPQWQNAATFEELKVIPEAGNFSMAWTTSDSMN
jgi:hypothetical protein